ncbi:MAG: FecR domain-containing protein [Polyangiaceae bacterium]|nr:FecR domain-containing protein [Polyangiaceae bacterium]
MDDRMKPMEDLLRETARESDSLADGRTARVAAQRALSAWEERRGTRAPTWRWSLVTAVLIVGITLGLVYTNRPSDALTFVFGVSSESGKVGAWISSPPEGMPLRFSDGTMILLAPGASARVTHTDAHGSDVLLERGSVHAAVVHKDAATSWQVHAGPFEIRVVGTEFDAAWEPASGALDVHVSEGRVIVMGPLLDDGRAVSSEERLRVSLRDSRFEMTRVPSAYATATQAPQVATAQAAADPTPVTPSKEAGSGGGSSNASSILSVTPPGPAGHASTSPNQKASEWRTLARAGKHKAALDAAVSEGYDRVLSSASAADLVLLADSARFAGDSGRAKSALLAARKAGEKGVSAFLLGKIAADGQGAAGEATQWFETYLSESPSGALAEQALGRLIELKKRGGQLSGARASAELYLQKYPNGGYAQAARDVLK